MYKLLCNLGSFVFCCLVYFVPVEGTVPLIAWAKLRGGGCGLDEKQAASALALAVVFTYNPGDEATARTASGKSRRPCPIAGTLENGLNHCVALYRA